MLRVKMIKKMILILFSLFFISCNNQNINQLYADWGFFNLEQNMIASRFVRNFSEKSHSNQAAFCSFSKSIFCSRRVSALM